MLIKVKGARKDEADRLLKALEPLGLAIERQERIPRGFEINAEVTGTFTMELFFTLLEPFSIKELVIKGIGYEFEGKFRS